MQISVLDILSFRNFEKLRLNFTPGLNAFIGDNGQGKTNLIEAIYFMSKGLSFRPGLPSDFVNKYVESRNARIYLELKKNELNYEVDLRIKDFKKSFFINAKPVGRQQLSLLLPTVLFSPESLAAIKEGPELRRSLLDDLVLLQGPKQIHTQHEYERCLRARNRVLKSLQENPTQEHHDTLSSLDKIYFVLSTHVTQARLVALRQIFPHFVDAQKFISGDFSGDIAVEYLISERNALEWTEEDIYAAIRHRHVELAEREIQAGYSLVGPHKHDVRFLFAGNDSRFFCSQGQQRALILAFKIAQIVYHHRVHQTFPILLLDDVLSELDAMKRANLMRFLKSISAQIFITTTELLETDAFRLDPESIFFVQKGHVENQARI